jgi:hypothetical protein
MIRYIEVSIALLVAGFFLIFLGNSLGLSIATYLAGLCFILSLFLYNNLSPALGLIIGFTSFLLVIYSPSTYMIAALTPLVGFFFSGKRKYLFLNNDRIRYYLFYCISFIYIISIIIGFDKSTASHNQLSIFVALAFVAETLYFGRPSRLYIILILISFFIFGNRSSIFLMAAFIKNKYALIFFLFVATVFLSITLDLVDVPSSLLFFFDEGGFFYRSFSEPRAVYLNEFVESFNIFNLSNNRWIFDQVPQTSSGFYDLHNSFLTIIVRDSYLGIFKVLLWILSVFYVPWVVFLAVTLRAFNDTFLFGGVTDIVLCALIGRSILTFFCSKNKSFFIKF